MNMIHVISIVLATGACFAHGHGHSPGSETSGLNAMVRQFLGGSKVREFIQMFAMEPLPDMIVGSSAGKVTTDSQGVMEQTFISPPMTLENGHVANKWLPVDWPQGHIAVKSFVADVVKSGPDGEAPPPEPCCGGPHEATREEVFLHHWTVNKWQLPASLFKEMVQSGGLYYEDTLRTKVGWEEILGGAGLQAGANGPCMDAELHLFFGIGNEVRSKTLKGNDPYEFPDPYGIEFDSTMMRKKGEFMVLNTHFIDIRNVTNKRACSECKCDELGTKGFLDVTTGGLSCCKSTNLDGGHCPLQPATPLTNQTYHLRYTMKWRSFDPATTLPLEVITFDATDNNTKWGDFPFIQGGFSETHQAQNNDMLSLATINDGRSGDFDGKRSCHIEYYVPPCKTSDSCIHRIVNSWELPYPMHIVFVRNHFHAGGLNMTTSDGDGYSCTGVGTYDQQDNLIDVSTCTTTQGLHRIERGQRLHVESVYQQDQLPHYGVMAMSFVYAHIPKEHKFFHV